MPSTMKSDLREKVIARRKWTTYAAYAAVAALGLYILIYLTDLVIYFAIAAVLTTLGRPLTDLLRRIHIGKLRLPLSVCAVLTIIVMYTSVVGLLLIFVPVVLKQARILGQIDYNRLWHAFSDPLISLETEIQAIEPEFSIRHVFEQYIQTHFLDSLDVNVLTSFFSSAVGFTGSFLIGFLVVTFMLFYFLSQRGLLKSVFMAITPTGYEGKVQYLSEKIQQMLRRYVVGLTIQVTLFATLTATGLWLFGVPGALFIGIFAGIANLIPYVGQFISMGFGTIVAVSTALSTDPGADVSGIMLRLVCIIQAAQLLDSIIVQPQVYSASVKAHPLEILIVIISAGKIGGIPAMVIAVPTYTILRLVAKQFFSHFKAVQQLTKDL